MLSPPVQIGLFSFQNRNSPRSKFFGHFARPWIGFVDVAAHRDAQPNRDRKSVL